MFVLQNDRFCLLQQQRHHLYSTLTSYFSYVFNNNTHRHAKLCYFPLMFFNIIFCFVFVFGKLLLLAIFLFFFVWLVVFISQLYTRVNCGIVQLVNLLIYLYFGRIIAVFLKLTQPSPQGYPTCPVVGQVGYFWWPFYLSFISHD